MTYPDAGRTSWADPYRAERAFCERAEAIMAEETSHVTRKRHA
jgi:hypothetical protein